MAMRFPSMSPRFSRYRAALIQSSNLAAANLERSHFSGFGRRSGCYKQRVVAVGRNASEHGVRDRQNLSLVGMQIDNRQMFHPVLVIDTGCPPVRKKCITRVSE